MKENTRDEESSVLEKHSRALFQESIGRIGMPVRSRLTRARHKALEAAASSGGRSWLLRMPIWKPASGVAAAAILGVALWFGNHGMMVENQSNLEDLDIVASSDPGSGDAIEMLQDDIDFYDFADKAANSGPAA